MLKDHGIVVGNAYNKYSSKNVLVRQLMRRFYDNLILLVEKANPQTIHEVGCGEGFLATRLQESMDVSIIASDFSELIIDVARELHGDRIEFEVRSIYDLNPDTDAADCIVCAEVLEHLDDPRRALSSLASVARPYCVMSVPREPIWRCLNMARGRYWRDRGNTPGHLQHWSTRSFVNFVSQEFDVIEVRSPLPWTMLLARVR